MVWQRGHYQSLERLDGVLQFAADGTSSEFRRRSERKCPGTGPASTSPWAQLAVLDPTREGLESLNLIPRLPPATQLLLTHELGRAHDFIQRVPRGQEETFGEGRRTLEEAFRPLPEGTNALPSFIVSQAVGCLVMCGEVAPGTGIQQLELALIESVSPRHGWTASFLLRGDERSEVVVRLLDLEERTGRCYFKRSQLVSLCPANFVCRVCLEKMADGRSWRLDAEGLERFHSMRQCIGELLVRRQKLQQQASESAAAAAAAAAKYAKETSSKAETEATAAAKGGEAAAAAAGDESSTPSGRLTNVSNLPSPSRSSRLHQI